MPQVISRLLNIKKYYLNNSLQLSIKSTKIHNETDTYFPKQI